MPKSKQLTEFERGEIVGLKKANFSIRQIAEILKRSKTAVENTINDYFKKNKTSAVPRSGRPKKLSEYDNRQIIRAVKENPKSTLSEITQHLVESNIIASESTIRRYLHSNGIYGRKAVKKPFVSEVNRKKRLFWSHARNDWGDKWNKIIFSDESRILLFQNDSNDWVWRMVGEKYKKEYLSPTVKQSDGIMVWGCFTRKKMGPLVLVEGKLNSSKYNNILTENLLPFINELREEEDGDGVFIFQEDNAPCHKSGAANRWKEENDVQVLPWPAQSPDLNPIENLWQDLKRRLRLNNFKSKNKQELFHLLQEEWFNTNPKTINKLIDSMPRRIDAVIKSRGNPSRY
jgi:transposase